MRAVVQRVSHAKVEIGGKVVGEIGCGLMILLGVEDGDSEQDVEWLSDKIKRLRIFSDPQGAMNLSLDQVEGKVLIVSQFTLHASTRKGNRPSFIRAARPEQAIPLYENFVSRFENAATGEFGADMQITLCNDGPVTIIIDSKLKE